MRTNNYDSTVDVLRHIRQVNRYLLCFCQELMERAKDHDQSKLFPPEKEVFDELTPRLKDCEYNSLEYKQYLKQLQVALDHHYAINSHHPEYYLNGIDDMDLFDLVEMYYDWKAASERSKNGSMRESLNINRKRFNMSDQLYNIFRNTLKNENKK